MYVGPALIAELSTALSPTARCISSLPAVFEFRPWHVGKIDVGFGRTFWFPPSFTPTG